ncbi:MAG: glycosyltransferase family A protein [Roseococcus sp.]
MIRADQLSIVIPAYDIAGYLEACLASIREHGGATSRVILVDDGSRDLDEATRQRLSAVFGGDLRWTRIPHAGAGAARNMGLSMVETPWVTFIDGDDVIVNQGLERLCESAEPAVDIVFSNKMVSWNIPKRIEHLTEFPAKSQVPIAELPVERRLSCHGKLFRTDFLHGHEIAFPEGMVWEDIVFSHRTYRHAERVSAIADITYFWLKRPPGVGSVTQKPLNPVAIQDRFRQVEMSVEISETAEWRANFGTSFDLPQLLARRLSAVFRAMRQPNLEAESAAALATIHALCAPHWPRLLSSRRPNARLLFEHVRDMDLTALRAMAE